MSLLLALVGLFCLFSRSLLPVLVVSFTYFLQSLLIVNDLTQAQEQRA